MARDPNGGDAESHCKAAAGLRVISITRKKSCVIAQTPGPMRPPHVLILFRHRYNPAIHRVVARHAGRARWHLSMLIHAEDKPLTGLAALQGIILADRFGDAVVASVVASGIPLVNLSSDPEGFAGARVTGDNVAIGRMAAEYLLGRHHRHFAFFGESSVASRLRFRGFADALAREGHSCLELTEEREEDVEALDWEAELRRVHRQLERLPAPAAVFCYNDLHASRLLDAALQTGRRVPEELAILGVDDDALVCENVSVPLSSVRHALEEVGSDGAALLESIMNGANPPETSLMLPPVGVTTRRSTQYFAVHHPTLQCILLYLDRHHHRALGLGDVADAVGVSSRTVQQLMQTHLRSSVTEEIPKRRFAHAQRLLAGPRPSVADIAALVGFSSATYFHHAFKRRTGQTPRRYREMFLKRSQAA